MDIEKSKIQEIISLHDEVRGYLKLSLEKAIRIGELLAEQKESLKHGEFTPWVKANLPFTDRTARNYMGLYRKRDLLKTETVSDLTSAYKLLAAPKTELEEAKVSEERGNRLKQGIAEFIAFGKRVEAFADNPNVSQKEKFMALKNLSEMALKKQNEVAEHHLRVQRKLGQLIGYLKDKYNVELITTKTILSTLIPPLGHALYGFVLAHANYAYIKPCGQHKGFFHVTVVKPGVEQNSVGVKERSWMPTRKDHIKTELDGLNFDHKRAFWVTHEIQKGESFSGRAFLGIG